MGDYSNIKTAIHTYYAEGIYFKNKESYENWIKTREIVKRYTPPSEEPPKTQKHRFSDKAKMAFIFALC